MRLAGLTVTPKDHPRVSGEHDGSGVEGSAACGSSPRERGALTDSVISDEQLRIIPA